MGGPVRATGLAEGAETQSVSGVSTARSSCWSRCDDGAWILAVPDGGGAGPLLAQLEDRIYSYALVVEPAQVWAVIPAPTGRPARRPHHRRAAGPVVLDCEPKLDVRDVYPAPGGALMIGECDTPREDTQMLWFLGPEPDPHPAWPQGTARFRAVHWRRYSRCNEEDPCASRCSA